MTCAILVNRCYEQAKSKLLLMNGQYTILHSVTGSRVPYLTRLPTKGNNGFQMFRRTTLLGVADMVTGISDKALCSNVFVSGESCPGRLVIKCS